MLEAVSNRLPVLCFNACGMGAVIDACVGRKVELSTPRQSAKDFAAHLNALEADRSLLKRLSLNCGGRQAELSWDAKARRMVEFYGIVLRQQ